MAHIDQVAQGIYRIASYTPTSDISFNQFLIVGVPCMHIEVAAARHIRCNHIEGAVMIADGRGEDAAEGPPVGERELTRPREDMPDLASVHEVAAVEERHAREILERAGHEEVVVPDAADARVRVEAGNDRIRKRHGLLRRLALGGSIGMLLKIGN